MEYTWPPSKFELTALVVIGTDCIGSCKSNYHTITYSPVSKQYINQSQTLFGINICLFVQHLTKIFRITINHMACNFCNTGILCNNGNHSYIKWISIIVYARSQLLFDNRIPFTAFLKRFTWLFWEHIYMH
jgi:hypothetical protein